MSAKPPPYIAKHKPEPLTWDTFFRPRPIRSIGDVMDDVLLRIRYRAATGVLLRLHDAGCTIRIEDGKLLIRPGDKISDDDKRLIGMVKAEMVELISQGCWERFESAKAE